MKSQKLAEARQLLDEAIKEVDSTHSTWSECVTALHMAEINLRRAERNMRQCYNLVVEALNGDG